MKKKIFMEWIVIGGLAACSVGVVVFSVIQQVHQKNENIAAKEAQLKEKDELINELKNLITGGDSFFYIRPSIAHQQNKIFFSFAFQGKYPLYDATVHYREYDIIYPTNIAERYLVITERTAPVGTLHPLMHDTFYISDINPTDPTIRGKRYFFRITTRNGLLTQEVLVRYMAGNPSLAYSVVTMTPNYEDSTFGFSRDKTKKRIRHIDENFPIDEITHVHGDTGWSGKYEQMTGKLLVDEK